jgi:hypothetical protein
MMLRRFAENSSAFTRLLLGGGFLLYVLLAGTAPAQQDAAAGLDPDEAARLRRVEDPRVAEPPRGPTPFHIPAEGERIRALRTAQAPPDYVEGGLNVRALEGFLDFDEADQILYGPGRTQVVYQGMFLEADRLILDNRLQEVQGEGNVIFRRLDRPAGEEIRADWMRYNFAEEEGVAFGARGQSPPIYFRTMEPKPGADPTLPPLRQISPQESIFRHTEVSGCDFVVPHYFVRAREIILFPQDRIFFRGASFYVSGVPVMHLPFYTRGLQDGSPWFFKVGSGGRTGTRVRLGYQFEHEVHEPSFEDESFMQQRSFGQAQWFADYLSKRGFGAGMDYKYQFDFDRHRGRLQAYGIGDDDRTVVGARPGDEPEDESNRWQLYWQHRSQLNDRLSLIVNIDALSDPEVYYDILDQFAPDDGERGRVIERRGRVALTYLREAYVARLLLEVKDRAGLNRFNNFALPFDDDRNFDLDPFTSLEDSDSDGISRDRWGRVTKRLPELTFATRYLPMRRAPLYYMSEISIYNNLDKGLNTVSTKDDAWVRGLEFYNQLLWQYKFTERLVLIAKLGAGAGVAIREESDLGIDLESVAPDAAGLRRVDNLFFTDTEGTFLVGDEEFNHDDIDDFYAWADASLRLNARFTDALSGYLEWRFRETTDDFVGDFYARIGDYTSREDLFNYRLKEHWLEGGLNYRLLHPDLLLYANAGINLKSDADVFPNERLRNWRVGARWTNRARTLTLDGSVGGDTNQVGAASDGGEQDRFTVRSQLVYSPIHRRWFTRVSFSHTSSSGDRIQADDSDQFTLFTDSDTRNRVTWSYGRELGPKWRTRFDVNWESRSSDGGESSSGLRDIRWELQRDLHDALVILQVRRRLDLTEVENRNDFVAELDFQLGLQFKLPAQEVAVGAGEIRTIDAAPRRPVAAY